MDGFVFGMRVVVVVGIDFGIVDVVEFVEVV